METFSALLAFVRGIHRFPSQRPMMRIFDVFFFICAWTNGWANNRDAGDMRRHWGQYDVTVMETFIFSWNEILHWNIGLCNTPLHGRIVRHSHEVPTEVCLSKANGHERRWYIRNAFSLVKALFENLSWLKIEMIWMVKRLTEFCSSTMGTGHNKCGATWGQPSSDGCDVGPKCH